jgi:hypothetical protein
MFVISIPQRDDSKIYAMINSLSRHVALIQKFLGIQNPRHHHKRHVHRRKRKP